MLLAGPPGLGKTSLAQIIAHELDVPLTQTAGPALERKGDIAAFLTALEPGSVFFIDEIHRLPRAVEESFYPAMEDRRLPIVVGQGAGAPHRDALDLPAFTLIGATTRTGLLTTPLRERFGVVHRLEHYPPEDLAQIVRRSARILEVEIEDDGAAAIAERARGTPRVANRLLRRVRDFAEVHGTGRRHRRGRARRRSRCSRSTPPASSGSTARCCGRSARSSAGPVGLSTLAVAVGEEEDTIEDVYEPYLLQRGLIKRTPRGRVATAAAYEHLGLAAPGRRALACSRPHGPRLRRGARRYTYAASMLVFICPNCGNRTIAKDRTAGFRNSPKGCEKCGFGFMFELLDDYYPAPDAAFFTATRRPASWTAAAAASSSPASRTRTDRPAGERGAGPQVRRRRGPVGTSLEWGVRVLDSNVQVEAEGDLPAKATADVFPAYDDDGGLLLVLTPKR